MLRTKYAGFFAPAFWKECETLALSGELPELTFLKGGGFINAQNKRAVQYQSLNLEVIF
ncbi:MAG: hypothetical protein LBS62_04420 [Clostridiales bacterium]|nr:hypothetical protein [Clostridiales bacterium]